VSAARHGGLAIEGASSGIAAFSSDRDITALNHFNGWTTLSFTGGTVNPPGGNITLWCGAKNLSDIQLRAGQLLAMQTGGFF
jgi:hypothetical protein